MNRKTILIIVAVLFIGAAGYSYFVFSKTNDIGSPEKAACESEGGSWERAGLANDFICVHTYPDGGKPCQNSEECKGFCIVTSETSPPRCKADNNPFSCFSSIENFEKGLGILCTD
jgi:hypothetical protein